MEELIKNEDQIISIILIGIGLLIFMSLAIVVFFYFSRKKIIKSELEKANMQIEHQKEVIQSTLITQEAERKRIAQDLHDAISSKLNIVSLNANFLTESNITSEEANKFGNSILKVTTTVLESSRKIAHDLLPPTLERFGLRSALEELCEEVAQSKKFDVNFKLDDLKEKLPPDQSLHLFRIVQELFSNSIKYSEASLVTVLLENKENLVSLQYKDDGKGFNLNEAKKAKGLGMSGIENRVSILNGTLSFESRTGSGISVSVEIETT